MSYEKVKAYFEQAGLGDRVVVQETPSDTVEHAAQAIGCQPKQIAKTMSFLQDKGPVLICMAGDAKVSNPKYKAYFHQKAVMIPMDRVEELTGHLPGGVCPFAVPSGVSVYLDVSLQRFEVVYTAGGSPESTVKLTLPELEQHSHFLEWIDVCKDWSDCS